MVSAKDSGPAPDDVTPLLERSVRSLRDAYDAGEERANLADMITIGEALLDTRRQLAAVAAVTSELLDSRARLSRRGIDTYPPCQVCKGTQAIADMLGAGPCPNCTVAGARVEVVFSKEHVERIANPTPERVATMKFAALDELNTRAKMRTAIIDIADRVARVINGPPHSKLIREELRAIYRDLVDVIERNPRDR